MIIIHQKTPMLIRYSFHLFCHKAAINFQNSRLQSLIRKTSIKIERLKIEFRIPKPGAR